MGKPRNRKKPKHNRKTAALKENDDNEEDEDDSAATTMDCWKDIPNDVRDSLLQCIHDAILPSFQHPATDGSEKITAAVAAQAKDDAPNSNDHNVRLRRQAQQLSVSLAPWLSNIPSSDILACLETIPHYNPNEPNDEPNDDDDDVSEKRRRKRSAAASASVVAPWVAQKYRQTMRAHRVFALLDAAGKGCVVGDDLHRAAFELWGSDDSNDKTNSKESTRSRPEQPLPSTVELMEMMQEFKPATMEEEDEEDIILSLDDIVRIARLVNL